MNKLFLITTFLFMLPILAFAKEDPSFHRPGDCGCRPYVDNTWYAYYYDGESWDYVGGPYNKLPECVRSVKANPELKDLCKR